MGHDSVLSRGWWFVALAALSAAGLALGWDKGQLPSREAPTSGETAQTEIAPDLALYCEVIARVRGGEDYYAAAADTIPRYGFPTSSPLNWRLPTYAWVLSWLPCPGWIQLALICLSVAAFAIAVAAKGRAEGPLTAVLSGLLLFGVVRWAIDGYACVAQEPWAATLLLVSLGAHALGQRDWRWVAVSIVSGTAALFFRELALPYCGAAFLVAVLGRRYWEGLGWGVGIAAFFGFYAWHVGQVHAHRPPVDAVAAAAGVSQWMRLGGLDFVLLTTRMNGLLFAAAGGVLWIYLLAALVGLARRADDTSKVACLAALGYVLAFAILGRPENFYWGLLPAPLLAWGAASAPAALRDYFAGWREYTGQQKNAAETSPAALV
jgi:hypothetical protein